MCVSVLCSRATSSLFSNICHVRRTGANVVSQRPPGRTHLYITHCTRYHFKISAHINKMILPGKSPNRKPDSFYNRKKNNTFTYSVTHTHADAHTHCTILHPSPGLRADSFVKVSRRGEGEWHCGTESSHRTLR